MSALGQKRTLHRIRHRKQTLAAAVMITRPAQFSCRPSPRPILEIDIGELLVVLVAHDQAGEFGTVEPFRQGIAPASPSGSPLFVAVRNLTFLGQFGHRKMIKSRIGIRSARKPHGIEPISAAGHQGMSTRS